MSIVIIEQPQHKCDTCGCVYSFDKDDFQVQEDYVRNKQISYMTYRDLYIAKTFVKCPVCDTKFIIKEKTRYK